MAHLTEEDRKIFATMAKLSNACLGQEHAIIRLKYELDVLKYGLHDLACGAKATDVDPHTLETVDQLRTRLEGTVADKEKEIVERERILAESRAERDAYEDLHPRHCI